MLALCHEVINYDMLLLLLIMIQWHCCYYCYCHHYRCYLQFCKW